MVLLGSGWLPAKVLVVGVAIRWLCGEPGLEMEMGRHIPLPWVLLLLLLFIEGLMGPAPTMADV